MNSSRSALVCLLWMVAGCSGGSGEEEAEPWADENGAMAEPSGSLVGSVGGLAFTAVVHQASFRKSWTVFQIAGRDLTSYADQSVYIDLNINREIVGVGSFDCSVLAEANMGANIPVESVGTVLGEPFGSSAGYPCNITIDTFGGVGEPITGSFSGTLVDREGDYTTTISGTINAIRGNVL